MIRILLVTHSLAGGGAERFAATLTTALATPAADVDPAPGARSAAGLAPGLAPELAIVSALPDAYPVPDSVPVHRLAYRGRLGLPRAVLLLRRLLRRQRPDVVLSNVLSTNALTGAALVGLRQRPVWLARVGLAPDRGDPPLRRRFAEVVYPRADVLVANSRRMAEALRADHPGVRRIEHRPNPVDFERLDRLAAAKPEPAGAWAEGEVLLLAVGRLTAQKRPDLALEVLARVRERVPARLAWLGDGPLRGEVEERAAALGLTAAVALPGFVANPFAWMRRADLFLLSSDFEGLPNALIEAQGLGLPAVATACRYGPDEIVDDGATGRIVPPGDARALAAATVELLADRERLAAMGEAARRRAGERYGLEAATAAWAELLAELGRAGEAGRSGDGGGWSGGE